MPESVRRPINKIDQARFHLAHLTAELKKPDGVRLWVVEAYLGACLGAAQSAFYILTKHPRFKVINSQWRKSLAPADRAFMNRMTAERDSEVHLGRTTLYLNWTLQPIDLGSRHERRDAVQPMSTELRFNLRGCDVEIAEACRRFIALMRDLIKQFQEE